jgi:hypothetical protein
VILIFKNEKLSSLTLLGEMSSSVYKASVGAGSLLHQILANISFCHFWEK